MSIARTIAAFRNFLECNDLPTDGVRITVEFDDYYKAHRACRAMADEFNPMLPESLKFSVANPPKPEGMQIMSIPIKFTANVSPFK